MFANIRDPHERQRAIVDAAAADGLKCFNAKDNVSRFIRSAEQMVNNAKWKADHDCLEESFYLYVKFSTLYLNKVRSHPSFRTIDPAEQKMINRLIGISLDEAEKMKHQLIRKFEEEEAARRASEDAEAMTRAEREMAELVAKQQNEQKHRQHHDDAVLAQQLEQEEQYLYHKDRVEAHRHQQEQQHRQPPAAAAAAPVTMAAQSPMSIQQTTLHHAANGPSSSSTTVTTPPATNNSPYVDRALKPIVRHPSIVFNLRKIVLPGDLASTFLRLAFNNTTRDTETCGVLAAAASENASSSSRELHVSHVLLPPQHGTPDSCTTEDEEKLLNMVQALNLVVVGWIHTHPSQTCFLSSVDLHTQAGYQQLFHESVAVVCSVKYNDIKVYRLTGPGLDVVMSCDQAGFHTHPGTTTGEPLFEECNADDAKWDDSVHVQVVDLRQ